MDENKTITPEITTDNLELKKKLLALAAVSLMTLALGACGGGNKPVVTPTPTPTTPAKQTFTVIFMVEGERYKTSKVKEGEKITDTIPDPKKEGFDFAGWYEDTTLIDLATYVVTKDVTFTAKFEEKHQEDVLNVDDVKEEGKEYYLVVGWWETTGVDAETGEAKHTSNMTKDSVRLFYGNLINFLTVMGSTEQQIQAISFRNYSTEGVEEMGEKINADADVDLMIGVGNNINSKAGVSLYGGNDGKFATNMGDPLTSRYVALLENTNDVGIAVFDWLKKTDAGKDSFVRELTVAEIEESVKPVTIALEVTITYGETSMITVLSEDEDEAGWPNIEIPEDKIFAGLALSADGEVVLEVAYGASLKYDDLKDLATDDIVELFIILKDRPVVEDDLVVYIQTNGSYLVKEEAELLEARFKETLEDKQLRFEVIEAGKADFKPGDDADVVIGGNDPLKNFGQHEEGALANVGAKHFRSTNRKVIISDKVNPDHLTLAKAFYDFVVEEAPLYEFHYTYWHKNNEWVTEAERTAISAKILENANTLMGVDASKEETLLDLYNVSVDFYVAEGTRVGPLGEETRALREGKGTDLIIGCGGNVDSSTGGQMTIVEKKEIGTDFVAASSRYVALVTHNYFAEYIYNTYFVASTPAE